MDYLRSSITMIGIGEVGGETESRSTCLARFVNCKAISPEAMAKVTGKKKASDRPTPSANAPIKVLAITCMIELIKDNLDTAQAVETPGM
jgi:hypothetical protein